MDPRNQQRIIGSGQMTMEKVNRSFNNHRKSFDIV